MTASSWSFKTAAEMSAALAAKKVSAVELAKDTIARIERHDGQINAICVRDFERGLEAAKAADAALSRGEKKPLLGVPMTVKESFNVAGLPTTWGFVPQKNFIAQEDALSIARVKAAGGVILAKTNVPVALSDWQSYNDIYGTTNNPFGLDRTPGGSSGGSSAALAAGYGALSLGSDIGGSLRVPAHYCGVYAHKPTFNLCPLRGHSAPPFPPLPFERDLSVIGPMARGAADLALLLDVIAGPDPIEAGVGYKLALPASRHPDFKGFRVLVLDSHPLLPVAAEVRAAVDTLARNLAGKGVSVARETPLLPDLAATTRLYMRMLMSFLVGSFTPEVYAGAQAAAAQLAPNDMSLAAERLRGITLSHRDWVMCNAGRTRLRAQWRVRCGDLPNHADAGLPARSSAGSGTAAHRHRRQAVSVYGSTGVARHRHAAGPSRNGNPGGPIERRSADRRADRRPVAGRSHAAETRRVDRARVRRLHATTFVRGLRWALSKGSVIPGREPFASEPGIAASRHGFAATLPQQF